MNINDTIATIDQLNNSILRDIELRNRVNRTTNIGSNDYYTEKNQIIQEKIRVANKLERHLISMLDGLIKDNIPVAEKDLIITIESLVTKSLTDIAKEIIKGARVNPN